MLQRLPHQGFVVPGGIAELAVNIQRSEGKMLNQFTQEPVSFAVLVDSSGSMDISAQHVISGQKLMLDALRGSEKCLNGALYVYQALFAETTQVLNGFYPLGTTGGKDHVALLNSQNYRPSGNTALCAAVIDLAEVMEEHLDKVEKSGFVADGRIAIITDGEENQGGDFAKAASSIGRLRARERLSQTVIIGIEGPKFTEERLEHLRSALGFSKAIMLARGEKEVRRAFILASKVGGAR